MSLRILLLMVPVVLLSACGDKDPSGSEVDGDGDGSPASEDCDDDDANVHPGAEERCDDADVDEDCDGLADDADPSVAVASLSTFLVDNDGDGFGAESGVTVQACDPAEGRATLGGDCDDTDPAVHPDATEVCDALGTDEDCDGLVDDADPSVDPATQSDWWTDADGDGFGGGSPAALACDAQPDQAARGGDCDDADAGIHPDAAEVCDDADADEDCDGLVDDADPSVDSASRTAFAVDSDGDGYGGSTTVERCDPGDGAIATAGDCDDDDPAVHPGASEVCDPLDVDEDCDGVADDADSSVDPFTRTRFYGDSDGDGHVGGSGWLRCDPLAGESETFADCDDTASAVHPGATEVCDAADTDEDCNGLADDADSGVDTATQTDWFVDLDGDGYAGATTEARCDGDATRLATSDDCDDADSAVHPGATEVCDAADTDEDCDGLADDADDSVDASTQTTWYTDLDGDGHAGTTTVERCDATTSESTTSDDCDDTDAAVSPSATEVCDDADTDEDCDGLVDADDSSVDPSSYSSLYLDADLDGYGDAGTGTSGCPSAGYSATDDDCDDSDPSVHPGATEDCDTAADDDCDGATDALDADNCDDYYQDADSDTYGVAPGRCQCAADSTYTVATGGDCDDSDSAVSPGAVEAPSDGVDNDCDGRVDEAGTAFPVVGEHQQAYLNTRSDEDGGVADGHLGAQIASGGDLDGDGFHDVVATAPGNADNGSDAGAAFVFLGPMTGPITATAKLTGQANDAVTGVAFVGDQDGDGYDDVLLGSPTASASTYSGEAALVSGIDMLSTGPISAVSQVVFESTVWGGGLGMHVGSAGDFFGTGAGDLFVATRSSTGRGAVYLFDGPLTAAATLDMSTDASLSIEATCTGYGTTCYATPTDITADIDLDGDGLEDVVLGLGAGAYQGTTSLGYNRGAHIFLSSGVTSGALDLTSDPDIVVAGGTFTDNSGAGHNTRELGFRVSNVGDVNGDGYDDLGMTSPSWYASASYDSAAYVFHGPITADLSGSDAAWVITEDPSASATAEYVGWDIETAGDHDDDGDDEFWVGSRGSAHYRGVLLYEGDSTGGVFDRNDALAEINGFDRPVLASGDLDADGYLDLLIGNPFLTVDHSEGGWVWAVHANFQRRSLHLTDQSSGFSGPSASNYGTHWQHRVGDVDNDGFDDLLTINSPSGSTDYGVWLHLGPITYGSSSTTAVGRAPDWTGVQAGAHVVDAADLDGDGMLDLLLGAPGVDDAGANAGAVYVVHGVATASTGPLSAAVQLDGPATYASLGSELTHVDDMDQDGMAELLVATGNYTAGGGSTSAVYLYDGPVSSGSSPVATYTSGGLPRLGGAGDLNGDGVGDFAVGDGYVTTNGTQAGVVAVFTSAPSGAVTMSDADAVVVGTADYDRVGYDVAIDGDVNGDGYDDLVAIGWGYARTGYSSLSGSVGVFYGPVTGSVLFSLADTWAEPPNPQEESVETVRYLGDHDGDGADDLLLADSSVSGPTGSSGSIGAVGVAYGPISTGRYVWFHGVGVEDEWRPLGDLDDDGDLEAAMTGSIWELTLFE